MTWAKDLFKKENVFSPNEAYYEAPNEDKEDVANSPMFVKVSDLRSWFLEKNKEIDKYCKKYCSELTKYEAKSYLESRAFHEIVEECKKQKERR